MGQGSGHGRSAVAIWADDIALVQEAVAKYGPVAGPFVEVGGLEAPTIADYSITIKAMERHKFLCGPPVSTTAAGVVGLVSRDLIRDAQFARYLPIHRPLESALPSYVCENPATGGASIETLHEKYDRSIGVLVCLSTLEHCETPWMADEDMHRAMRPGGLLILSVPWIFPLHDAPHDHWRFSPTGLRRIFEGQFFEVLWCDWRQRIGADAGVLDIHTGRPQAIESCALIARAK